MNFKLIKQLKKGRYYVSVDLDIISEEDIEKAKKFGWPTINIKSAGGIDYPTKINSLKFLDAYGFYNEKEANEYAEDLKKQIKELKINWEKQTDTWSNEEEL